MGRSPSTRVAGRSPLSTLRLWVELERPASAPRKPLAPPVAPEWPQAAPMRRRRDDRRRHWLGCGAGRQACAEPRRALHRTLAETRRQRFGRAGSGLQCDSSLCRRASRSSRRSCSRQYRRKAPVASLRPIQPKAWCTRLPNGFSSLRPLVGISPVACAQSTASHPMSCNAPSSRGRPFAAAVDLLAIKMGWTGRLQAQAAPRRERRRESSVRNAPSIAAPRRARGRKQARARRRCFGPEWLQVCRAAP